jgi:hypothetical protein
LQAPVSLSCLGLDAEEEEEEEEVLLWTNCARQLRRYFKREESQCLASTLFNKLVPYRNSGIMFTEVLFKPLALLVGSIYPAYLSFKALEDPQETTTASILTYWLVYSLLQVVEVLLSFLIKVGVELSTILSRPVPTSPFCGYLPLLPYANPPSTPPPPCRSFLFTFY